MVLENPNARLIAATVVPLCWMVCSSGLILLNKHLMMEKGFKYPVTLSGLGQAFSALAAFTTCRVLKWVPAEKRVDAKFFAARMLPVGFFNATTLMFGNAVYMYLTVAFIQMLKAFTPVITLIGLVMASMEASALLLDFSSVRKWRCVLQSPTTQLIGSVCVIAGGTAVAGYGEINMSITGMLIQLVSETSEALRLIMTQTLLQGLSFHPIEGMMYLAPACLFWMIFGAAVLEFPAIIRDGAYMIVLENPLLFFGAATMGFGVTTLAFFTIQLCGSLTLKVLGTVKNAALVLFCVLFLREPVSIVQAVGYTFALAGFSWYQYIKLSAKPMIQKPKDNPPFDVHKKHSGQADKFNEGATGVATGVMGSGDNLSVRSEMSRGGESGDSDNEKEREGLLYQNGPKAGTRQSALESLLLVDRTHFTPQPLTRR